ncbi:MAG TPA: hypothetical protein PLP27_07820 [Crocinitomicaceae bacterium]|nr:hypothetical protein [Crocinitomicaceae bacterium]
MKKVILILFLLVSFTSWEQETLLKQIGIYSGIGTRKYKNSPNRKYKLGMVNTVGISFMLPTKGEPKLTLEPFIEYEEDRYSYIHNYYSDISHVDYKIGFLGAGLRLNYPIVEHKNYQLSFRMGVSLHVAPVYLEVSKSYDLEENLLSTYYRRKYGGRFIGGASLGFKNEFYLSKSWVLHANLNLVGKLHVEWSSSDTWDWYNLEVGVYRYLQKRTERPKRENIVALFGVYGGSGIVKRERLSKFGTSYNTGVAFNFLLKKFPRVRTELAFQYSHYNYHFNPISKTGGILIEDGYLYTPDAYASGLVYNMYKIKNDLLNFWIKNLLPLMYKQNYRLFFTSGFTLGGNLKTEYYAQNSEGEKKHEVVKLTKAIRNLTVGLTAGLKNEFKLSDNIFLQLNLNTDFHILYERLSKLEKNMWKNYYATVGIMYNLK